NGTVGKALAQPLVVRAVDRDGNLAPGARLQVNPIAGRAADSLITTDSSGQARIRWTLGQSAGVQRLLVRIAGENEAVEATARARASEPATLKFVTTPAAPAG